MHGHIKTTIQKAMESKAVVQVMTVKIVAVICSSCTGNFVQVLLEKYEVVVVCTLERINAGRVATKLCVSLFFFFLRLVYHN